MPNSVFIPDLGHNVVLVDREQLRRKQNGRTLKVPTHLKALATQIPTPPTSWDGSKARMIKYPILGNDQYGDCYYADMAHCVQTWTGNVGQPAVFDERQLISRYLEISGGDNGLSDGDVFPEWKGGIVGPNGPHKILDDMTVSPNDDNAIKLGMWLFCGCSWTCSLLDTWLSNVRPGAIWDAGGRPDPSAGHAMHLSGYDPSYYQDETWAIDPAIRLTPAGLKAADPEVTVQFSLEMFDTRTGIAPHIGMSYDTLAALWVALGGQQLPPSPWGPSPPPPPPPPPGPPSPAGNTVTIATPLQPGVYGIGGPPVPQLLPAELQKLINFLLSLLGLPPLPFEQVRKQAVLLQQKMGGKKIIS